jgi:hypothetical protein
MKALVPLLLAWTVCGSKPSASSAAMVRVAARVVSAGWAAAWLMQAVVFKDKIWMRKESVGGIGYICDRGRLGSAAFEAYREKRYDQISCSLAQ